MFLDRRFTAPISLAVGGLLMLTVACGTKKSAPEEGRGTPTMQAAPDDLVPERASFADTTPEAPITPPPPPLTGRSPGATAPASGATGGAIIGYDSAFGPSYALDSAGRPIPIKRRKP